MSSIITRFMASVVEPQFVLARDLTALALSDGEVTHEELEAIGEICRIEDIDETQLLTSLENGNKQHKIHVPKSRHEKEAYLKQLILLIGADKHCSPQEIYLFQIIASKMGLNQMDVVGLFLLTTTHIFFHGGIGNRVLYSFLKNQIDPLSRTEAENRNGLRQIYEIIAANSHSHIDREADTRQLKQNLSKATCLLRENYLLKNSFQQAGIDFENLLTEEEGNVFKFYSERNT